MVSEANLKVEKVCTANRHLKASISRIAMHVEDIIRKEVKDMGMPCLTVHEAKVDGVCMMRRCKYLDQVLWKFLLDKKLF